MLDPEDPDVQNAVFGRQVELFLETDIGQYLVRYADAEVNRASEALKYVDPEDPKAIRELQFKVRVAESVIGWLGEAIQNGAQSRVALEENR